MLSRFLLIIGLIAALLINSGCACRNFQARETPLDTNWGRSYETAKYNQILNPEAEKNLDPVVGLDAVGAENNMDKYRESFKKAAPRPIYNINIGSLGEK
ncbi:MAG: pilus assembly protein [Deltaproteobacteria bacterium]|nr:pilus assembly protein [Deltaproteobacteria bacterium]MBL7204714.1 pilus assembly protein [Desulfobacteraceae bacterium]